MLVFAALAVTFAVGAVARPHARAVAPRGARRAPGRRSGDWAKAPPVPWRGRCSGRACVLGLLLWRVAGQRRRRRLLPPRARPEAPRVRRPLARRANEFPDGGLHPGYAFPLWHGFLALVAKVSGTDPIDVVVHGPTVLAPLVVLVAYEAGWALFRRTVPAAAAVAAGVAVVAMAPGHGGALTALALPATGSRQLLVPAALALALEATRHPTRSLLASAAAASLVLAVVHPTYALFLWIPFVGFLAVRWLWERRDARAGGLALAALVVPAALFFAWLLPVISDTESVSPDAAERDRAFDAVRGPARRDARSLRRGRPSSSAAPARSRWPGLLLLPLAGLAARRRWAAYVVGGLARRSSRSASSRGCSRRSRTSSRSRRRGGWPGYLPLAFALAGGIGVLARLIGRAVVPARARRRHRAPARLPRGLRLRARGRRPGVGDVGRGRRRDRGAVRRASGGDRRSSARAALAAALLLLPTYVHGFANWSPSEARAAEPAVGRPGRRGPGRASPDGRDRLRRPGGELPARRRRARSASASTPPGHVADTVDNRPRERVREFRRFARTGDLAIPRACGATWLVVDLERFPELDPDLPVIHRDGRWMLYRL